MIVSHKEGQGLPPKEFIEAITKLGEEATKAGTLLSNGGLGPTSTGARVRVSNGKVSVIDGPFVETKEIIGGFAVFELNSKEEAVELCRAVHGTPQTILAWMGRRDGSSPNDGTG